MTEQPPPELKTNADIIAAFGGPTPFGRACGFVKNPGARGSDMKQRDSIPVDHWPAIVSEAERRGLPITAETLLAAKSAAARHGGAVEIRPDVEIAEPQHG